MTDLAQGNEGMDAQRRLRETFETSAARYHRARPGYPEELFADLIQLAGLGPESRILEIGPGTGIATLPLARRGFSILGIELGAELARQARKNLAKYPNARIETGTFEDFPFERSAFDLVMAATAFHWIEQPAGYRQIARTLRPGGHFAVFRHHHVWGPESDDFFIKSQEIYDAYDPRTTPGLRLPKPEQIGTDERELEATKCFEPAQLRRYMLNVTYTPESYADLLMTFSDHIAQPEPNRSLLIDGLASLIAAQPGGTIVKAHLIILHVARLRANAGAQ